jgi:hypothetical protein
VKLEITIGLVLVAQCIQLVEDLQRGPALSLVRAAAESNRQNLPISQSHGEE